MCVIQKCVAIYNKDEYCMLIKLLSLLVAYILDEFDNILGLLRISSMLRGRSSMQSVLVYYLLYDSIL